jgi:hypothetical protein
MLLHSEHRANAFDLLFFSTAVRYDTRKAESNSNDHLGDIISYRYPRRSFEVNVTGTLRNRPDILLVLYPSL